MTNRGVLVAAAVLVVANGLILGGVAYNRRGDPDAVVRLSERELESWGSTTDGAEEILNLRLRWTTALGPDGRGTWFDRARLEALGVTDLPEPGDTGQAMTGFHGTYPGFAVLELAGPAWERWAAAQQARADSMQAERPPEAQERHAGDRPWLEGRGAEASRLMAVDIGRDPAALREQYPDRSRYLILPANYQVDRQGEVRDSLGRRQYTGETVTGRISQLLPGTVHVPRPLRDSLLALGAASHDSTRHFEVTYKVGRKYEGWVE